MRTGWLQRFAAMQIACQLALLVDIGALRVVPRLAAFLSSLALVLLTRPDRRSPPHPARRPATVVLGILALQLLNPWTQPGAGLAQAMLSLAVLSPLIWVPRVEADLGGLKRLLLVFWLFHVASAFVGVLQVQFPGSFQPNLSAVIATSPFRGEALKMVLASGDRIYRPTGLTDVPGGAATSGVYAVLLGLGVLLTRRDLALRSLALAGMFVGMFCLYVCQVRSLLVQALFCLGLVAALLARRGQVSRALFLSLVVGTICLGALSFAIAAGGESVTRRLMSLLEGSPSTVYYKNRGIFLEYTLLEVIPTYPLGAGLGRWGMMNYYFGTPDPERLWVEIQWTAWIFDGGVPLALAYAAAVGAALAVAWRLARLPRPHEELALWAVIVLAYDMGALALTFNYSFFQAQTGLEFWLLNAALHAAAVKTIGAHARRRSPAPARP